MDTEVLIVGAGPVGLTMAAELRRYDVAVRIVDKSAQRTDKSKALVLWSRTLELLDRGVGADAFVAAGMKVTGTNIVAGDRVIGHIEIKGMKTPYCYALMLPQSDTERLLEEHLAKVGVKVERQVEALGFTQDKDSVTTTLKHPDGKEEVLQTKWLIGCDGAHSVVRHTLGLEFHGDTMQTDWILADLHIAGLKFPDSELAMFWHQDGVLATFPISPGRYRIIADMGKSEGPRPADPTLEQVQAMVDRRGPGGLTLSNPIWLAGFRINERKVNRYRVGRVFVAGDAAHVHSPAGGQGMNTGMQDAFNLSWKLAMACRGCGAADTLLDSYSVERSAVGDQVLKAAGRLTAAAVMKNHAAQAVRNWVGEIVLGLAPVQRAMVEQLTEVSIGYAHSPLNGHDCGGLNGPSPGERVPVAKGDAPICAGATPRFTLFAESTDDVVALLRKHDDLLDAPLRRPLGDGGVWLARPDGYVACVARAGDLEPIAEYLEEMK